MLVFITYRKSHSVRWMPQLKLIQTSVVLIFNSQVNIDVIPAGIWENFITNIILIKGKAIPQHTFEAQARRGCIAPTHSRLRH
jgi:hypothetical protein